MTDTDQPTTGAALAGECANLLELVEAAREIAYGDVQMLALAQRDPTLKSQIDRLDRACEKYADAVRWDDTPEDIAAALRAPAQVEGEAVEAAVNDALVLISEAAVMCLDADDDNTTRLEAFGRGIEGYLRKLALNRPTAAPDDEAVRLLRGIVESASSTYNAGNGRMCSIEGDDGEQAMIVPHEPFHEASAFLPRKGSA